MLWSDMIKEIEMRVNKHCVKFSVYILIHMKKENNYNKIKGNNS